MDGGEGADGATAPAALNGGCFCGKVKFQTKGPPMMVFNCHCTICQRLHGAPFARFVYFPPGGIKLAAGAAEHLGEFRTSEKVARYHCRVCASPVYGEINPEGFECVSCPLTVLERGADGRVLGLEGMAPQAHNFYAQRIEDVDDGVAKHEALPPGFEKIDVGKVFSSC